MEIKILGTGCSSCKALYANTKQAIEELGIKATIVKQEDLAKIIAYNVMALPALVVDEKVVAKGKLSLSAVKEVLKKECLSSND